MKFSGIIIAFYLLVLAAMPCSDTKECENLPYSEASSNHADHEDEEEGCTPFCICVCCPASVYISDLTVENVFPLNFASSSCEISSSIYSFISHSIWQPPRNG